MSDNIVKKRSVWRSFFFSKKYIHRNASHQQLVRVLFFSHTYKACRVASHRIAPREPRSLQRRRRRTCAHTTPQKAQVSFPASVRLSHQSKCACPRLEIECRLFRVNDPFVIQKIFRRHSLIWIFQQAAVHKVFGYFRESAV